MNRPELADDPRYATHDARGDNQEELEQLAAEWARARTGDEILRVLGEAGVVCGPVYTAADIAADPQVQARDMLVPTTTRRAAPSWVEEATMSDLPERISLREVGPRDGLQNEAPVPLEGKVALLDALSGTGVSRIEAVSFVHPRAIPQMADADEVWRRATRNPDVRYSALVPNQRGAQRALDAGFTEIEVVLSASDTHNRMNLNRSTAESLDNVAELIETAHARGATCQVVVATAFGCPYEGEVPVSRVVEIVQRAVRDGADSLSFGDTTGMATPTRVTGLIGEVRSAAPDTGLNLHFHNTRGTGLANVLAALQLGVTDFDASVGGLGGCPYAPGASGNIATEELVHMVEDMGVGTGVNLEAMIDAARTAETVVGRELPSQVLRAGPRTRRTPRSEKIVE